jgi:hypothetical protein
MILGHTLATHFIMIHLLTRREPFFEEKHLPNIDSESYCTADLCSIADNVADLSNLA